MASARLERLEEEQEESKSFFFRTFFTIPLSGGGTLNLKSASSMSSSSSGPSGGSISFPSTGMRESSKEQSETLSEIRSGYNVLQHVTTWKSKWPARTLTFMYLRSDPKFVFLFGLNRRWDGNRLIGGDGVNRKLNRKYERRAYCRRSATTNGRSELALRTPHPFLPSSSSLLIFWFKLLFQFKSWRITQIDNLVPIWNKPVNRETDKSWNECEFIQYYAGHSLNGLFESWPGPNRFGYKRDLTGTGDTSRHDATDASFVSYTVFGGDNPSKIRAVCQTGLNTVVIFIWRKRTTFCPGLFLPPNLWNLIGCKWDPVHDVVPLPHIDMWSN